MGRFVNEDGYSTTGQGFLGNNMFVYCLNNPVIYKDSHGEDACIVIDDDGALENGHIGFLVQDDKGKWWHFYWGPKYPILCMTFFNVKAECWFVPYEGDITLDDINASGQYGDDYDRMIYLTGDFSDCVTITQDYISERNKYNLIRNNCSQVSLSLLSQAYTRYQKYLQEGTVFFIPKNAFSYIEAYCSYDPYKGVGGGKQGLINMLY